MVSLEAPVYLSSQSYMADSSLSEEMSQFDFSTGVQSFSFSSQNPGGHGPTAVNRVSYLIFSYFCFLVLQFNIIGLSRHYGIYYVECK